MDSKTLSRRTFLYGTALMASAPSFLAAAPAPVKRVYHVLGIPLRSGSLYPGTENDALALREAGLLERLKATKARVVDEGELAIPSYLPHHSVPPIRSWPGPRIVWDGISERLVPLLKQRGHVPILVGCDCSVVVGSTQALEQSGAENIHVLYIDGDFDNAAPTPEKSQSAASVGVWVLTHDSPFWIGPPLQPSQVTVIGNSKPSQSADAGVASISLVELREVGVVETTQRILAKIPSSASIVLHFDIDVLQDKELPAAYFPHPEGLNLSETTSLVSALMKDPRIRVLEMSEYASLRDVDRRLARQLVDLLAKSLI
jgi:arginase